MTPAQRRFAQIQRDMEQQRLRQEMMAQFLSRRPQAQAPVRKANGGMITAMPKIPSLMELAQPNFQMQQSQISEAPFTQTNPVVPMSVLQSPAFGGMPQDVYDWTPSQVTPAGLTATPRQAPAMTTSTSTYTPVDTSSIGGMNIPGAADLAAGALPGILDRRRAEEERLRQEQARQAELEQARQAQAEELMRRQQEFEAKLAEQGQLSQQQFTDYRTQFESSLEDRINQGVMAELTRRDEAAKAAEAARLKQEEDARAAANAAAAAEAAKTAEAARLAEEQKRLNTVRLLTGGYDSIIDAMSGNPPPGRSTPTTFSLSDLGPDGSSAYQAPTYDNSLGYGNN